MFYITNIVCIGEALADMKILALIFVCCLMGMGESSEVLIGDESTLIDMVLEDLPVKKCDSIIVSPSPLQGVGRTTLFFTNVNDLIAFMGDEDEFVKKHLSTMDCFFLGSKQIMKSPIGHLPSDSKFMIKIANISC